MHHRAICLLPPSTSPLAFSSVLLAAAGRAWVRSATSTPARSSTYIGRSPKSCPAKHDNHSHGDRQQESVNPSAFSRTRIATQAAYPINIDVAADRTCPPSTPSTTYHEAPPNSVSSSTSSQLPIIPNSPPPKPAATRTRSVRHLEPQFIQDSDFETVDHGRSDIDNLHHTTFHFQHKDSSQPWYSNESDLVTSTRGTILAARPAPIIPPPRTKSALYQNLLLLISHSRPLPSLPALLDYHDLYKGLRSTRSYNLLISLALRHVSYGTAQWLFTAMRADGVPGNLETWKLKVRWLVETGSWDKAWADSPMSKSLRSNPTSGTLQERDPKARHATPIPVQLEFFRTMRRGSPRSRSRVNGVGNIHDATFRTEQGRPSLAHIIQNNSPILAPEQLAQSPPRAIYFIVMTLLKAQQNVTAFSLTKTYFESLPPAISTSWARGCLDIIHLHIILGSSQRGLRKFYESRRAMVALVTSHRALCPTSTTLYLLLSPLRAAKKCGTVAWKAVRRFKRQWGAVTEDRRVRRRLASLALKEGRMDIVDQVLRHERIYRWAHGMWRRTREVVGRLPIHHQKLIRPPMRKLFRNSGKEERLWCSLTRRIKRRRQIKS